MSDLLPLSISEIGIFAERSYTFNRLLGEGSYAKVWHVTYGNPERNSKEYSLACKVVDSKKAPRDFITKFLPREMDILAKINHPHLIHLHSIYQRKSKFFIFMRFAEKGDLLDHILAHGEVKEIQARVWTRQLALGLQYLHQLDVVHRDIKCENVLITANNNVKLADFGFARFICDSSGKKYLSSTYCGSLAYAAPELIKGRPYDPKRSDIWSFGVVLYVMLNQCMPFNDKDMKKLYELQINSKWTWRTKIAQTISEDVKNMVQGMLEPIVPNRLQIEQIVNSPWFQSDIRLMEMDSREREALDTGILNKSGMLPKSQKLSMPSWKKRKKDEQIVCVTSVRIQHSSDQFALETMTKTQEGTAGMGKDETRNKSRKKIPDEQEKKTEGRKSKIEEEKRRIEEQRRRGRESSTEEEKRKQRSKTEELGNKSTDATSGPMVALVQSKAMAVKAEKTKSAAEYAGGANVRSSKASIAIIQTPSQEQKQLRNSTDASADKKPNKELSDYQPPQAAATLTQINLGEKEKEGLNEEDSEESELGEAGGN